LPMLPMRCCCWPTKSYNISTRGSGSFVQDTQEVPVEMYRASAELLWHTFRPTSWQSQKLSDFHGQLCLFGVVQEILLVEWGRGKRKAGEALQH